MKNYFFSEGVLEIGEDFFKNEDSMELSAELSGGQGDCAWQHSQLFRMREDQTDTFPFFIHLKFGPL